MFATRGLLAVAVLLAISPGVAQANLRNQWRGARAHGWLIPHPAGGPTTAPTGDGPDYGAFDPSTHTLYVPNYFSDTVSVIDTARCHARRRDGCAAIARTLRAGHGPNAVVFDARARPLYVTAENDSAVAVVDASRCNATDTSGCDRPPVLIGVDADLYGLALDAPSDT